MNDQNNHASFEGISIFQIMNLLDKQEGTLDSKDISEMIIRQLSGH